MHVELSRMVGLMTILPKKEIENWWAEDHARGTTATIRKGVRSIFRRHLRNIVGGPKRIDGNRSALVLFYFLGRLRSDRRLEARSFAMHIVRWQK